MARLSTGKTSSLDALTKLWNTCHEVRRCPTGLPNLHTPKDWILVWALWVVLTWQGQPPALTPGLELQASLWQYGEGVEPTAVPLVPNISLIPVSAEEKLAGSMRSTFRPDPDCRVTPGTFPPSWSFQRNSCFSLVNLQKHFGKKVSEVRQRVSQAVSVPVCVCEHNSMLTHSATEVSH